MTEETTPFVVVLWDRKAEDRFVVVVVVVAVVAVVVHLCSFRICPCLFSELSFCIFQTTRFSCVFCLSNTRDKNTEFSFVPLKHPRQE